MPDTILMNCPECGAILCQEERELQECWTCEWPFTNINTEAANAPKEFDWDREIDDNTES